MSLNLGLESLGISTDDVSFESVLASQVEMQDARTSFEHAMFDLATTARNVQNFNEIVGSLQKHSSVECAEFAVELLGVPSVEAAKEVKIPLEKQSKTAKKFNGWWESVKAFVKKCYNWIKKQINKLLAKTGLVTELTRNPKVKVHWKPAALANARGELNTSVGLSSGAKMDSGANSFTTDEAQLKKLLSIKLLANAPKGAVLDLKKNEEARTYLQNCLQVASFLYELTTSIRLGTTEKTGTTSLKYQSALVSRIQNTQKYVLADVKAIGEASAQAAGKITGRFTSIKDQQKELGKQLANTRKEAKID